MVASAEVATEEPSVEEKVELVQEVAANERVELTDAAMMDIITHYCGHEAGVRNLRKCLDRVFRKIVAKIETAEVTNVDEVEYQINTQNLERFLDVAPSDDSFYMNINK